MRFGLAILIALLCCGSLAVTAQEEYEATVKIAFLGTVGQPLVERAGFREFGQTLIEHLEANLEANHLDLFFVDYEKLGPRSVVNITIALETWDDKSSRVYILPTTPDSLELSPVLTSRFTFADIGYKADIGLLVSADQLEIQEVAINLATALSLYSINRCDLALPFFQTTEDIIHNLSEASHEIQPYVAYYRGNCLLLNGEFEDASALFGSALNIGESLNLAPAINLAWTYLQIGEKGDAFDVMRRSLSDEVDPRRRAILYSHRAQLHALVFNYDAAIADMDAAIELDPDNPELYVLRGQMVLLTYEWDAVLADYNRAIELDPDYADAYFYRGVLFYTQGPREQALEDFKRYLELAPDGEHVEEATKYIESIKVELEALGQ